MRINVRLFAVLRQQAGWREREMELPEGATIADAWAALTTVVPDFSRQRDAIRFARNREYATAEQQLSDGDELALIPPVAGGSDTQPGSTPYLRAEMTAEAITDELLADLRRTTAITADGAVVLFLGQTRETPGSPAPGEETEAARHAGKPVVGLEYEAFEEMALAVFHAIAAEIEERFGVIRLAIVHRTGRVMLGEASVAICAAAPHRGAAFEAARYAIEELKARAPIWKSEEYADGSVWIGAPARERPPTHC